MTSINLTNSAELANMAPVLPKVHFEVCPLRSSIGVLGRKWALLVLQDLAFLGEMSFSRILMTNKGLTPRMLSMRLRDLRNEGLIERFNDPTDRRIVRHRLTEKGRDVIPILTALIQYGIVHNASQVFADGRPRNLQEVFPDRQKSYAWTTISLRHRLR